MTSPTMRSASSPASRKVSAVRSTSVSESRIGLPISCAMSRASSTRRSLIPTAICRSASPRLKAGSSRVVSSARTAASTASSYCSGLARYVMPAGASGRLQLGTVKGSSEISQRPARYIRRVGGCASAISSVLSVCVIEGALLSRRAGSCRATAGRARVA